MRRPLRRAQVRRVAARAGLRTLAFSLGVLVVSAGQAQATTVSFTDPYGLGTCSNWTVPDGVSAVRIIATGTAGTSGMRVLSRGSPAVPSGKGGAGGVVSGTLSGLTSGDLLRVCVDEGSGGGGPDPDGGGGGVGGGASSVAYFGATIIPLMVAGGGGGGGDGGCCGADQGGGQADLPGGLPGEDAIKQPGALGGGGGTQTQGGAGGAGDSSPDCGGDCGPGHPGTGFDVNGVPGKGGYGGQIVTVTGGGGGGGGGGYYGGGGGGSGATPCTNCYGGSGGAGGGGGSDFCAASLQPYAVTLSGCADTSYNADPDYTTASVVLSYPVAPPAVSIATPAGGASYVQGQAVSSRFSCDDGAGGSWLVSCVDQSGRPSGSPLDTSTLGSHTFTVTATTRDGMAGTATVTYQVLRGGGGTSPGGGGGTSPGGGGGTSPGGGGGAGSGGATITNRGRPSMIRHGGTVLVELGELVTCPPGTISAQVSVNVTTQATTRHGFFTRDKGKQKTVTIGSASFAVAPGTTEQVTFKLSGKGIALLRRLKRLLAKATVTVSYGRLAPVSSTRTVRLTMPRKGKPNGVR